MPRSQLEQSLGELRAEIDRLDADDAAHRERLEQLVDEIETQLAAEDDSALGAIRQQIESFEVEHPRVTAILNDIMVTLSNLGI